MLDGCTRTYPLLFNRPPSLKLKPLVRSSLLDVGLAVRDSPYRLSNLWQCPSRGIGKVARKRAVSPPIVTKLLTEPWQLRELAGKVRERAAEVRVNSVLSSTVSPVYSTRSDMHFDMTKTQQSYVRLLQCHCYTESLLYSLLETVKQQDAALVGSLSYRDARARKL